MGPVSTACRVLSLQKEDKVKVKAVQLHAKQAQKETEVYSATHIGTGAEGGGWSAPRSGPLYPQERDLVHIAQVAVNILIRSRGQTTGGAPRAWCFAEMTLNGERN